MADNKELIVRCLDEVWSRGNLDALGQYFSPDVVRHGPPSTEGDLRGLDGMRQVVTMYRTAYPDLVVRSEQQLAEGDTVVTRWSASGTHRGEAMGLPPTGRSISVQGVIVDRFAGGRVVEEWASYDALGMLQQLGAVPAAGA